MKGKIIMAKGAIAKKEIMRKIIEVFPNNSFLYNDNKEIRINTTEEDNPVQIKITLTCAKTPVENENRSGIFKTNNSNVIEFKDDTPESQNIIEPTEEEKANLKTLLDNFPDNPPWVD